MGSALNLSIFASVMLNVAYLAYDGPWETLARLMLAIAIFGSIVAIVVELVRLAGRGISAGVRSQTH